MLVGATGGWVMAGREEGGREESPRHVLSKGLGRPAVSRFHLDSKFRSDQMRVVF